MKTIFISHKYYLQIHEANDIGVYKIIFMDFIKNSFYLELVLNSLFVYSLLVFSCNLL